MPAFQASGTLNSCPPQPRISVDDASMQYPTLAGASELARTGSGAAAEELSQCSDSSPGARLSAILLAEDFASGAAAAAAGKSDGDPARTRPPFAHGSALPSVTSRRAEGVNVRRSPFDYDEPVDPRLPEAFGQRDGLASRATKVQMDNRQPSMLTRMLESQVSQIIPCRISTKTSCIGSFGGLSGLMRAHNP